MLVVKTLILSDRADDFERDHLVYTIPTLELPYGVPIEGMRFENVLFNVDEERRNPEYDEYLHAYLARRGFYEYMRSSDVSRGGPSHRDLTHTIEEVREIAKRNLSEGGETNE